MTLTKLTAVALAGLLTVGFAASVLADAPLSADAAVKQRQAAMKQDGRALKGSISLTGAKAIAVLQTVVDNYGKLPSLFPKDSITADSVALPAIWDNFDAFSAIFKKGAAAATDGIAAVKAGDIAKYKADIGIIAQTCDTCHTTYRAKDQ